MDGARQDLRCAIRSLARSPRFTAVAALALALGIGANTALFTVVDAVLLRALPYDEPDRMVTLVRTRPSGPRRGVSVPKFFAWRAGTADVLSDVAVYDSGGPGMSLSGHAQPEQVKAIRVSRDYFSLFRTAPALGRFFTADEDRPGGPLVAVLSHGLWTRRFGADPLILGRTLTLDGRAHTVVGVVAPGFEANPPADVWVTLQADPASADHAHFLLGGARLRRGVTLEAASARLKSTAEDFRSRFPDALPSDQGFAVLPMRDVVAGDVRPTLLVLWAAVALVQLIACANVANLLLARSLAREREMTIRSSLGATRARLLRQLLIESLTLALVAGGLGLLLGRSALAALLALAPPEMPALSRLDAGGRLDASVLAFTLAVSLASGVLFGLLPALRVSRVDQTSRLGDDPGRARRRPRQLRLQGAFLVSQLALSLALLAAAALLIRSALLLSQVRPGFRADGVLTFKTALNPVAYSTTAAVSRYTRRLIEGLERLPGVRAAASVSFLPTEASPEIGFAIEGRPWDAPDAGAARWRAVSPRLFEVLGIPLLRGRSFAESDAAGSAPVAVVNETMVRRYWPREDPIGQRIVVGGRLGPRLRDPAREIVGVVGDTREDGLPLAPPPVLYLPQPQVGDAFTKLTNSLVATSWVVSTGDPRSAADEARRALAATDTSQAGFDFRPMAEVLRSSTAGRRFVLTLMTAFAGVALLLAAIGIYGLCSYALEQRTREVAVRLALGAERRQVLSLLMREGLGWAATGIAIGLAAALAFARALAALLFGVQPTDPPTLITAALLLAAVAALATWMPAWRVSGIDPGAALRHQ